MNKGTVWYPNTKKPKFCGQGHNPVQLSQPFSDDNSPKGCFKPFTKFRRLQDFDETLGQAAWFPKLRVMQLSSKILQPPLFAEICRSKTKASLAKNRAETEGVQKPHFQRSLYPTALR